MKVAILTPIAVEYAAVRPYLKNLEEEFRDGAGYEIGTFTGAHQSYEVILRQTGSKVADIALATERTIRSFEPDLLLVVGIAGGVKDVDIGDIVVGTKAYGYESGKVTPEDFVSRPDVIPYSVELIERAQSIARKADWLNRIQQPEKTPKVVFGPIASGDKVITSTQSGEYNLLKRHFNDTTAIEMESIGVAKAALRYPFVRTLNIRSISDLLDHKTDNAQPMAAAHAAAFTFELLYQLDIPSLKNLPPMDVKNLSKEIVEQLLPVVLQKAGKPTAVSNSPHLQVLLEKVEKLAAAALEELENDPEDTDVQALLRTSLRKKLDGQESLQRELTALLDKIKESTGGASTIISNSKNVIHDSNINTGGGNFHVGDNNTNYDNSRHTTTHGNSYTIKGNSGSVHIGDVINITQVVKEATAMRTKAEASAEVQHIQELAMNGKIKPALESLLQLTKTTDSDLHNQSILLASRWNRLKTDINMGILSHSNAQIEQNRIVAALLATLEELN